MCAYIKHRRFGKSAGGNPRDHWKHNKRWIHGWLWYQRGLQWNHGIVGWIIEGEILWNLTVQFRFRWKMGPRIVRKAHNEKTLRQGFSSGKNLLRHSSLCKIKSVGMDRIWWFGHLTAIPSVGHVAVCSGSFAWNGSVKNSERVTGVLDGHHLNFKRCAWLDFIERRIVWCWWDTSHGDIHPSESLSDSDLFQHKLYNVLL